MCWLPIQNCANVSEVTVGTWCNPEQGLDTSLELSPEQNNVLCASHWADLFSVHPGGLQFLTSTIRTARQVLWLFQNQLLQIPRYCKVQKEFPTCNYSPFHLETLLLPRVHLDKTAIEKAKVL